MSKVLVSLVSDQTIPNVQLIKEFEFIDKYLFLSSSEMERLGKRSWIISASGINPENVLDTIVVDQHSFEDIEKKISEFEFRDDDELYVNVTGGTKIMSLAIFEYFKNLKSEIFYITGFGNEYIKLFPKTKNRIRFFTKSISLNEYLESYGFKVKVKNQPPRPKKVTRLLYNLFNTGEIEEYRNVLGSLDRRSNKTYINDLPDLKKLLDRIEFQYNYDYINKYEVDYLTGGWLEEFVYTKICEDLSLDHEYIGLNLTLSKFNQLGERVDNEFDVLFIYKNKLYIIECKTSIFLEGGRKSFIGEVIYKSDSLQKSLGLFANTSIFTCSYINDNMGNVLPTLKDHLKRAELNKLTIISHENDMMNCHTKDLLHLL